ncbi:hypothetical protein C8R43DRAFT_893628 [Mycena crocata]|nr:hypothetical protein C8R43DRAFT_893628 [Mycena crocata]
MQLSNIFLMAVVALASSGNACKCVSNGSSHTDATQFCCAQLRGNFNPGNGDCAANSISEHLCNQRKANSGCRQFRGCCGSRGGFTSDCDFPKMADQEEIDTPQAEGVAAEASVQKKRSAI